jgi:hypothetical protein
LLVNLVNNKPAKSANDKLNKIVASIEEENANAGMATETPAASPFTPFAEQNN